MALPSAASSETMNSICPLNTPTMNMRSIISSAGSGAILLKTVSTMSSLAASVFIDRNVIHMTSQYGESYHERIVLELNEEPLSSLLASTGELSLPDFFRLHQGIIQVSPENQAYILSLFDGIADELATQDPGFRLMALEKLTRLLALFPAVLSVQ